jgi:toxin ParE1/3/4
MAGFVLTEKAKADLKSIAVYTKNTWGREQRNRYLSMLDKAFYDLADNQLKGTECGYLREGYRKFHIGKHFIFYHDIDFGLVEIVRILHERMDIEAHFS